MTAIARPVTQRRASRAGRFGAVAAASVFIASFAACVPAHGQSAAPDADPWKALAFLEGTWQATVDGGSVKAGGHYTFTRELDGHVLARFSTSDPGCAGPVTFDCAHGDVLYVFQEAAGQPLKGLYLDNEGHVIHYAVTSPAPNQALFLSDPSPGPRFRLVYALDGSVMTGRFQMQMPGSSDWRSYLEWSGSRR